MAKTPKTKKQKLNPKPDKETKKPKPKKRRQQPTTPESDSDKLATLLEPYTKDQLVHLISTAAVKSPSLHSHIVSVADLDVSHRKVFIHGLGWDTTRHSLVSAFESFGEIEDCTVVTDRATGKSKGFAFVTFQTRQSASEALKNPRKEINNRVAWCQLASVGPLAAGKDENLAARRVYVGNVGRDVDGEKLRVYFARFGEIEAGPIGFDVNTGKSRGFAIFVYRTVEGAKMALEEPYKMFEGNQLHCQKAFDIKSKSNQGSNQQQGQPGQGQGQQQQQPGQQQVLAAAVAAAAAAAQNMALFTQHPGLLAANYQINPGLVGAFNPAALNQGMLNHGVFNPGVTSQVGGLGGGSQSVLGAYGAGQGLQHLYPNVQQQQQQQQQQGVGRGQGAGPVGGSFAGYPSYMWLVPSKKYHRPLTSF